MLKFPGRTGLDNGLQLTATRPVRRTTTLRSRVNVRTVDGSGTAVHLQRDDEDVFRFGRSRHDVEPTGDGDFRQRRPVHRGGDVARQRRLCARRRPIRTRRRATPTSPATMPTRWPCTSNPAYRRPTTSIAAIDAEGTFRASLDPSEEGNTGNGVGDRLGNGFDRDRRRRRADRAKISIAHGSADRQRRADVRRSICKRP